MKHSNEIVLVISDDNLGASPYAGYLSVLSETYELLHINHSTCQQLNSNESPDALAALIYKSIVSALPNRAFRVLVQLNLFSIGYSLIKNLIGHDLEVYFVGVFGEGNFHNASAFIAQSYVGLPIAVHYFSTSTCSVGIPPDWELCELSFSDNTVACAKFCERLAKPRESSAPEYSYNPLFVIQNGVPSGPSVFCMPGAGDNVTSFIGLSMALGSGYSIYGMQPRGVDGLMIPQFSISAIATSYIEAIKSVKQEGPIHLIGHSFGGWAALEVAANINANETNDHNLTVESLTIIDSEIPGRASPFPSVCDLNVVDRYIESVELFSGKTLAVEVEGWLELRAQERIEKLHKAMVVAQVLPPRSASDTLLGPYNTFATALRIPYSPQFTYSRQLRLVLAPDDKLSEQKNLDEYQRIHSGWQEYAPDIEVFLGGGNHVKVLSEPHVSAVSDWWVSLNNKGHGDTNRLTT